MSAQFSSDSNHNRRRRRRNNSSKQLRLILIVMVIIALICALTIGILLATRNNDNGETTGTTQSAQNQDPNNPSDPSDPDDPGNPSDPSNPSSEPTISSSEIQLLADELVKKADLIAAGYDYAKAISMLKEFEYYDRVPALAQKVSEYTAADSKLVSYARMDQVTHIFFHSLIVDTNRAFDRDGEAAGYNQWMTTVDEFKAILESMYERGYVLVTPYDVAYEVTDENGTYFKYGNIRLPAGKKPFIMSQDDLNYYAYMISNKSPGKNYEIPVYANKYGDGFASKIVIGEDGYPTCEYVDANGNVLYGDYDLVPILETFIQEHPDFSYHGARAVLGMTGYEGVFGYRTKPDHKKTLGEEKYNEEVAAAKAVAECLKEHGWILASHSYGHPAYGNISADRVDSDSFKWENTVQPIVGNCDIILYPHGSDIAGIGKYTFDNAKFKALYDDGYRYFFNVDSSKYWSQLGANYFRGGRRNVDGYRMYYDPEMLTDLLGTKTIQYYDKNDELVEKTVSDAFDKARPCPVPQV